MNLADLPRARRILHVIFTRRMAGSERYCADLANRQARAGDEVHVLGMPGAVIEQALEPAVRFHALKLPRLLRGWQLRRLAERLGVDIVHAHLGPACKALAKSPSLAKVATLHVGYKPHQHGKMDGLVCVNQGQLSQLGAHAGLARVISNWLPLPLADRRTGPGLRERLGLSPATFVIGAVGRLDASKGMDLLVQAFRASAPADAALVILGEGRQRAELERLSEGDARIHLAGFCADVQAALPAFDLFVSPSREETFGLALLEAMSAGLPVVASAAEGPRELLRGQPAQLVAVGSAHDLAAGLAHEFARRDASGRLPRVRYELSAFEGAASVEQIGVFYAQVLARRNTGSQRRPTTDRPIAAEWETSARLGN